MIITLACILLTDLSYRVCAVGLSSALLMIGVCWLTATMINARKTTAWIGRHNFTLYIFSWFFQAAMMVVCEKTSMGWIVTFFLMFLIGAIGPLIVIYIYGKAKFLQRKAIKLIIGAR